LIDSGPERELFLSKIYLDPIILTETQQINPWFNIL